MAQKYSKEKPKYIFINRLPEELMLKLKAQADELTLQPPTLIKTLLISIFVDGHLPGWARKYLKEDK